MIEAPLEAQAKLFAALSKAQQAVGNAHKNRKGQVGQNREYKYADLDAVDDAIGTSLTDNGLAIVPIPGVYADGTQGVTIYIVHEDGGWIREPASIPCKADSQGAGSGLTYIRRYILVNILLIVVDDDDGRGAMPRRDTPLTAAAREMVAPSSTAAFDDPQAPRQAGLGSLTLAQMEGLRFNTKFPSLGILGGYLQNGPPAPPTDQAVRAWSEANPGADGIVLLRAAASYAVEKGTGKLREDAQKWLATEAAK